MLTNFFRAHTAAAEALREHARRTPSVGITLAVQQHEPYRPDSAADQALAAQRDAETNGVSFAALGPASSAIRAGRPSRSRGSRPHRTSCGIQYYSRVRYDVESGGPSLPDFDRQLSQMAWEVYPEGFPPLLERAAATGLPVYVTENGICCDDDRLRVQYIADHLAAVDQARRAGADVRGYFYWSSMDNFEWNFGYEPKFGLIAVDRETLRAHPAAQRPFLCRGDS